MTSNDIKQLQIIATTKDGQHCLAITDDTILIQFVASICKFRMLKDDMFEQVSLKEILE